MSPFLVQLLDDYLQGKFRFGIYSFACMIHYAFDSANFYLFFSIFSRKRVDSFYAYFVYKKNYILKATMMLTESLCTP